MTEERAPYGEVQMIAQAEKPCCWNCRWYAMLYTGYETGKIVYGCSNSKSLCFTHGCNREYAETFWCSLHEPKEEE